MNAVPGVSIKLANESFVSRAPADVVDQERTRAADNADQIGRLKARLQKPGS